MKKVCKFVFLFFIIFCLSCVYADEEQYISYSSNVQGNGWVSAVSSGEISGTVGKGKRIEQYKVDLTSNDLGKVMYRSFVSDIGWQEYVSSGEVSGSVGHHVCNIGWMDWAKNDEVTGTDGYAYQIEAIQIKLVKKGNNAPGKTNDIYREKDFGIKYSSNVQSNGWTSNALNGVVTGTVGITG